jgi:hypothetical protein
MENSKIAILSDTDIILKDETSLEKIANMLEEQVESTKGISITDAFDEKNFDFVKKIKNGYVKNRNTIARVFKADRDYHTKYNQANRKVELEILAKIEQEENRLSDEIERAEFERVKEERKKLIPFRKMELEKWEATATDDDLLSLSDLDFEKFSLLKKDLFLQKKEQERIQAEMLENSRKQAEKEREEAIQREKEEAERKAKEIAEKVEREKEEAKARAEEEKQRAIRQERERQEEEARKAKEREEAIRKEAREREEALIAEQKAKDQARRDAIEAEKKAKEEAERKEEEEREKAEKNKKFLDFLSKNNFDKSTMEWKKNGNCFEIWTLPKKIAEITI